MDHVSLLQSIDARLRGPVQDVPGLPPEQQLLRLTARAEHLFTREELAAKLASGKQLKVKLGIDPTGTHIHIGNFVVYRKLRMFQRFGHHVQFVIGSFTAMIGDTSDKLAMRTPLTREQVQANFATYRAQLEKHFAMNDPARTSFRENGEWLFGMNIEEFFPLLSTLTVAQMLERENFKLRYEAGTPIGIHEFTYPLLQGWDSVVLESDVELGGTDQLFNCLRGRDLQERQGQPRQVVMTMPLLLGTDGRKMSKSYGNYVSIAEVPNDAFGKLMSVTDAQLEQYAKLLTDITDAEWAALADAMADGLNPKDVKLLIARAIVADLHDWDAADSAERAWVAAFSEGGIPADLEPVALSVAQKAGTFADLLVGLGLCSSKSEARRLFEQGGVKEIDASGSEQKLDAADMSFASGAHTYKIGKRHFVRTVA